MNKKNKELFEKFLSILFTAVISALITFLQTLVIEPASGIPAHEQITYAGVLGSVIRAGQEVLKSSKIV